jgi:thiamine-phosphate pyrophosphorylase
MQDAPIEQIRAAGLRLGLSTHGYAEMLRADAVSPSYIALGAVFPTTLKRMQTAPQGIGRLYAYAKLMKHTPLVAIGGIDEERIPLVIKSGVGSIAMVRALIASDSPETSANTFQSAISSEAL